MGAATVSCGWVNKQWCQVEVGEPCSITSNRASNRKQAAGTSQPPRHELRSAAHHNNIITKSVGGYLQLRLNTTYLSHLPFNNMCVCVCVCVHVRERVCIYVKYIKHNFTCCSICVSNFGLSIWEQKGEHRYLRIKQ